MSIHEGLVRGSQDVNIVEEEEGKNAVCVHNHHASSYLLYYFPFPFDSNVPTCG